MQQLLILSGKGGTGKTTIASAFIKLSDTKIYADCDVDAPNLHLITEKGSKPHKSDFYGLSKAYIDSNICISCGKCMTSCRFDAINNIQGYKVDVYACEGCGVCEYICEVNAISLKPDIAGDLLLYSENNKLFSTARLKMGSGNSGKLVTEVKKQMLSSKLETPLAIIDGSPGIGCPVIASISGVDLVLIVAEPSISGISDMQRIIKTAEKFGTAISVCVNKYDTNIEKTIEIEQYCKNNGLPFTGKIPFDIAAVRAVNNGLTIVDTDCISGKAVKSVYKNTIDILTS